LEKDNLRGIVAMLAGMACMIVNDAFVKLATAELPSGEAIFLRGVFTILLSLRRPRCLARRGRPVGADAHRHRRARRSFTSARWRTCRSPTPPRSCSSSRASSPPERRFSCADPARGVLAFRFGLAGVYFAILIVAFAELARIGLDHWSWVGGSAGLSVPVERL
jgi:hypothetical protein